MNILEINFDNFNKILDLISSFINGIGDIIVKIIDVSISVIKFIYDLILIIIDYLDFLPEEIRILYIPLISILICIFIYRFLK